MCSYRTLKFAVAVMLVFFAAGAQADTQLLTNPDVQSGLGGWSLSGEAGWTTNDNRPHAAYVKDSGGSSAMNITTHNIVVGEQFSLSWDASNTWGDNVTQTAYLVYTPDGGLTYPTIISKTLDLGSFSGDTGTNTWATYDDLSFTAVAGAPYLSYPIGVQFTTGGSGSTSRYADFDKVNLNLVTPEPGTIVLLITGLLGLLAYAWRKRR
jgi:hypothetical protein